MNNFKTSIKGFIIGAGMSVPGISGGTLAILLGLYNRLLNSVADLLSDIKNNLLFLFSFSAGAVIGILLMSNVVSYLLSTPAEVPLRYAFLGIATGCIPPILKEARFLPLKPKNLVLLFTGISSAALISLIPHNIIVGGEGAASFLTQLLGGVLVAVGLVLPGISASQMLYMLGLYELLVSSVSTGEFVKLIPFFIGAVSGAIAASVILARLFSRTNGTFIVILGFMIFSLKELIPAHKSNAELIIGLICFIVGLLISVVLFLSEKKEDRSHDIVQNLP